MYRIKQFRPNLRNSYGLVRVRQWSEKIEETNILWMLKQMRRESRILGEDITSMHIMKNEENIACVWFECSNPKYSWDKGYFKFMVTFRPRTMKERLGMTYEEEKANNHKHLSWLVETASNYFNEEGMTVETKGDYL